MQESQSNRIWSGQERLNPSLRRRPEARGMDERLRQVWHGVKYTFAVAGSSLLFPMTYKTVRTMQ